MLGAIVGDIVGSVYEWDNIKTKDFPLFTDESFFTDDSVMTIAIAEALLGYDGDYAKLEADTIQCMQKWGARCPDAGYGGSFSRWLTLANPTPYNSYGNGAAMRVSSCAYAGKTIEEALLLSDTVTGVTHNHPEGIKAARAVTEAIFMARHGASISDIGNMIENKYYHMDFTLDDIRPTYDFDVTCQGSVPQAIEAFLESTSFEDAIRNAISIGGDSDTIAAITGSIAEAYYGIPNEIASCAIGRLLDNQVNIYQEFCKRFIDSSLKNN